MTFTNISLFVASFILVLCVALSKRTSSTLPKGHRRVPGPKGLPLVGNTLQLKPQPQRQFSSWAFQYGELFQIQMGWENWVFVNSPQAVREILDKNSAVTSGRIPMPVASDIVSGGMRFLLMGYTPEWRRLRAIVHKLLTPKVSATFMPSQEFEAKQLVYDLLTDNEDEKSFYMHVRRYTTSVIMTSTYGRRIAKWQSEDIREVYGLMREFSEAATPGAFIADLIPPLAKIPVWMQLWRKRALKYQQRQTTIWMKFWNDLKEKMENDQAPDCFVRQFMETDYKKQNISELQAAYVAGTMIEAGSETTSASLNSCFMYLAANPNVQDLANQELTTVIGSTRTPTFADEPDLPYIRSIVKEILRIRPVTNIGSPHYTTADVTYKDYFIPKGTVVSINQYALHFDPNRYRDPEAFIPDRYLNHPLKAGAYAAMSDPEERDHFSFGAGRRICPGMHLAENSLFITLAKILWAFEIRPPLGEDGREEVVDTSDAAYEDGSSTIPKPYRVRFLPRSEERERVVRKEWEDARRQGYFLGDKRVTTEGMVMR